MRSLAYLSSALLMFLHAFVYGNREEIPNLIRAPVSDVQRNPLYMRT